MGILTYKNIWKVDTKKTRDNVGASATADVSF